MKKGFLFIAIVSLWLSPLFAQQVTENNYDRLTVRFTTSGVKVLPVDNGYSVIDMAGYVQGGVVGCPSLPVQNNLIAVPFCNGFEVTVKDAVYDTIRLDEGTVLMPLQPSRSKSDTSAPRLHLDEAVYATDSYFGQELASVEYIGVGRDINYATLSFSPVSINPVKGEMVVCRSAEVSVSYRNPDAALTVEHYRRYHTPAFSLGTTLNTLPVASTKEVRTSAPIRMVIMAGNSLQCHALEEFADWKREQGMLVDLIYTQSTANAIADQLKAMYTDATDEAPAPTFLLLVGDVAQMPVHNSRLDQNNDHITDLYYATWTTGDILPDCYWGRFSATDTSTLRGIIAKTVFYERYQFLSDDYLARAALVSGVDYGDPNDNAYRYCDPTMDYAAYYYINAENGFNTVKYYKNNVNFHPTGVTVTGNSQSDTAASRLLSFYSLGAGWINYSAHGNWNCWYEPAFYVSDVNRMNNVNMPSVMIGNCCLSNKFEKTTCFGEALLRRGERAGAVAYIGGTNSTYWTEDFYWSVGVRSNIRNTMNPNYSANNMGVYDRLFHTHGEALDEQVVTVGKLLAIGNMSVQNGPESYYSANGLMKKYYWEIYELMGDPSLLPWLGKASDIKITVTTLDNEVQVQTVPGAYVALVEDSTRTLSSADFADVNGIAHLARPANDGASRFVTVTAQGCKPLRQHYSNDGISAVDNMTVAVTPNPASSHCEVAANGLKRVLLLNTLGQTLQTVPANADRCTVSLSSVPAGLYLLRIESAEGTCVRKLIVK